MTNCDDALEALRAEVRAEIIGNRKSTYEIAALLGYSNPQSIETLLTGLDYVVVKRRRYYDLEEVKARYIERRNRPKSVAELDVVAEVMKELDAEVVDVDELVTRELGG
jgi:hypothetical protein